MNASGHECGFTLVETLVALAILAAVLVATYSSLSNSFVISYRLSERLEVANAVESQINSLRYDSLLIEKAIEGQTTAFRWKLLVTPTGDTQRARSGMFRIIARITPKGNEHTEQIILDTVLLSH